MARINDSGLSNIGQAISPDVPSSLPTAKLPYASTDSLGTFDAAVNEEMSGAPSVHDLPPLQLQGQANGDSGLEPILEDDPASYDLVAPPPAESSEFSLEKRSQLLFSRQHLQEIFAEPSTLLKFTAFLSSSRPSSVPMLIYYLDALKALRAIKYANAIAEALEPIGGHDFTAKVPGSTVNGTLEQKASHAFDVLTRDDLPAFITHQYIQVVSASIVKRITGTLAPHLKEASEGLAEVFCLTDPSRHDNPIVFASEEFHRTTQYGMDYVLGRNCRFLQGPWTNANSVRRLRESVQAGKQHQEVFLNYRRDGSPFMNLLMCAPLCDSRGKIRYFIGAQVDVSGLVKDCTDMEGMARILEEQEEAQQNGTGRISDGDMPHTVNNETDEFQALSEMLNMGEIATVRKHGGRMHREVQDDSSSIASQMQRPRLLLKEPSNDPASDPVAASPGGAVAASGRLSGVYQHYLLVRPYPSLRILFASPSQRIPGTLQSHFLDRIGGSPRVREELVAALAEGRGVTAKVRWVTLTDEEGGSRWIHCTPLLGSNGAVGVWMVVIVNDEKAQPSRRGRTAPPVTGRGSAVTGGGTSSRGKKAGSNGTASNGGDGGSEDGDSLYRQRSSNRLRHTNGYGHSHGHGAGVPPLPPNANGISGDVDSRTGSISSLRI